MVFSCFPGKLDPDRVFFHQKTFFESKILKNDSDSESTFFQCIRFWSENGFRKNRIWCKLSAQKTTRGSFYNVRTPRFVVMSFPNRTILGKKIKRKSFEMMTFEKNQILKQLFNDATDFKSRVSKRVRFLAKFTRLNRLLIKGFTGCQVLKWNLYIASDLEVKRIPLKVSQTS